MSNPINISKIDLAAVEFGVVTFDEMALYAIREILDNESSVKRENEVRSAAWVEGAHENEIAIT
jgi:hypothetical protein